jgi:hypothetical protein
MTQDEIIRMANEAGLWSVADVFPKELERFAALVAEATKEKMDGVCEDLTTAYMVGFENGKDYMKEKAAKICDDKHDYMCSRAAAAIRGMK